MPRTPPPASHVPALARPATPEDIRKFVTESRYGRSVSQRTIDGELGPAPMTGVIHYPYSQSQKLYLSDFRAMVSNTITHPFVKSCVAGFGSVPHHLLAGSNFDDAGLGGVKKTWVTETERSFTPQSLVATKSIKATGVRSECVQFLG